MHPSQDLEGILSISIMAGNDSTVLLAGHCSTIEFLRVVSRVPGSAFWDKAYDLILFSWSLQFFCLDFPMPRGRHQEDFFLDMAFDMVLSVLIPRSVISCHRSRAVSH